MKLSDNFDIREFVPRATFERWGANATWFISPLAVLVAEFYKEFWTQHFKEQDAGVDRVAIVINNWHTGGPYQYRGYRPPECTEGAKESQHRFHNAFDCEIVIIKKDGSRKEADYKEIHRVIQENEALFLSQGITCVEDVSIATGWLHTDFRWTQDPNQILIVKP